jgi:uncharacterized protein YidB (DUF937 family)
VRKAVYITITTTSTTNNYNRKNIMGILDTVLGVIKGQASNNAAAAPTHMPEAATGSAGDLLESVIGMITDPNSGGLSGLIDKFTQSGLAEQVSSWISTGKNLPISAEQIQEVLGSSFVQGLAEKVGIDVNDVAGSLSNLLPQIIDKLTPDGEVPGDNNLLEAGLAGLKNLLADKTA